jgi:hypothetical protein
MQIHLSKPGGQREGPFTVDQINRDLAARKYNDSDYWAWYDGLGAWIPLHSVPGVKTGVGGATEFVPKQEEQYSITTEVHQSPDKPAEPESEPAAQAEEPVEEEQPAAEMAEQGTPSKVSSGMPVEALEHIFVFTSGDGPSLRESAVTSVMLLEIIGENPDAIRDRVPRDVFGKCNIGERIRTEGTVPASAWRAMSSLQPELVQKAKEAAYRTCVRTFKTETGDVVAVFLFYNKETM